jgi:hypothetical protein
VTGAVRTLSREAVNDGWNRSDQGYAWQGHFQTGDHVIYAGNTVGTIAFTLQKPVAGIGFQLEADGGIAKSATVQIFDIRHQLLSSLTQPALGGVGPSDNTATFFGFYDHGGRIASVSISPNDVGGFGMNQVSLLDQPRLTFVGTPLQPNCYDQSVAALATQYGEIIGAAAALGFPSLSSLQGAIKLYCNS